MGARDGADCALAEAHLSFLQYSTRATELSLSSILSTQTTQLKRPINQHSNGANSYQQLIDY